MDQNLKLLIGEVRERLVEADAMLDDMYDHVNANPVRTPTLDTWDDPQTMVVIKFHPSGRTSCECKEDFRADVRHGRVRVISTVTLLDLVDITRYQSIVHYKRMDADSLVGGFTHALDGTTVYTIMRSV